MTTKDILDAVHRKDYHAANEAFTQVFQMKVDRRLMLEKRTVLTTEAIEDLRADYDEKASVDDGTLYRKGVVVQVWWGSGRGKETWTAPSESEAKRNFQDMKERWTDFAGASQETNWGPFPLKVGAPISQRRR
jgi:hypothetical protein